MNKKTLIIVGAVTLILLIAIAYGAQWYFSVERQTTVTSFVIGLEPIPEQVIQYQNITLQGQITFAGTPVEDTEVFLYKNGISIESAFTNSTGHYSFEYNVTDAVDSTPKFKTGIFA